MSTNKQAVRFLDSEVNAIPGTCHIILRYLTSYEGSTREEIREHLEPQYLVGGVQKEDAAFANSLLLLRNLGIVNEENGLFSTSIKLLPKSDGSPDLAQFRYEISRVIVEDSTNAVLAGGDPSDLVKYILYFSTVGAEESFDSMANFGDLILRRFRSQGLNEPKWNSIKRWMSSLGLSRLQVNGNIYFDPSELLNSIASNFETKKLYRIREFAEAIGDRMPSLVNPTLRHWFRSQSTIVNQESYMDFSDSLVWSLDSLVQSGRFKIELLDDDKKENIVDFGNNRQESAITFYDTGALL
jgi:hypothetical protein